MANNTNTVAKGDAFEDRVFLKFKELLESGNLSLDPKYSRIHQKKSYRGKSNRKITFDIVIETYKPNETKPFLITLIECKDYKTSIPVDKIVKFAYDINEVKGHKGIFVTTNKIQSGTLKVIKAEKISLVIMDDKDNLKWKIQRVGKRNYQIKQEIEEYISNAENANKYPFIAISGNYYYTSIIDFLSDIIGYDLSLPFEISYIGQEEIERKVSDVFNIENRNNSKYYMKTEELIDFAQNQLKINLDFESVLNDEIGYCDFQNNKISITKDMGYNSPRWRFTFAHELGHYILHYYLYEKYNITMANDDESNFSFDELTNNSEKRRLEIQANIFASKLLVPDKAFNEKYFYLHKKLNLRNFPTLYVDHQKDNIINYDAIIGNIAQEFNVSKEVIKYKLLKLGYLKFDNQWLPSNNINLEESNLHIKFHISKIYKDIYQRNNL